MTTTREAWVEPKTRPAQPLTPNKIAYLASLDDDPYKYVPADDGLDAILAQARRDGMIRCLTLGELY